MADPDFGPVLGPIVKQLPDDTDAQGDLTKILDLFLFKDAELVRELGIVAAEGTPATVEPGKPAQLSAGKKEFPRWHFTQAEVIDREARVYPVTIAEQKTEQANKGDPSADALEARYRQELKEDECKKIKADSLFRANKATSAWVGFKNPLVRRLDGTLKGDGTPNNPTDFAILASVLNARRLMPRIPVALPPPPPPGPDQKAVGFGAKLKDEGSNSTLDLELREVTKGKSWMTKTKQTLVYGATYVLSVSALFDQTGAEKPSPELLGSLMKWTSSPGVMIEFSGNELKLIGTMLGPGSVKGTYKDAKDKDSLKQITIEVKVDRSEEQKKLKKLPAVAKAKQRFVSTGKLRWTSMQSPKNPNQLWQGWIYDVNRDAKFDYGSFDPKYWKVFEEKRKAFLPLFYQRLARPIAEAFKDGNTAEMNSAVGAFRTMLQEATPCSFMTYDTTVISGGSGFAADSYFLRPFARAWVANAEVRRLLYSAGFYFRPVMVPAPVTKKGKGNGNGPQLSKEHYELQLVDLSDVDNPRILFWDTYAHFYGHTSGGDVHPPSFSDASADSAYVKAKGAAQSDENAKAMFDMADKRRTRAQNSFRSEGPFRPFMVCDMLTPKTPPTEENQGLEDNNFPWIHAMLAATIWDGMWEAFFVANYDELRERARVAVVIDGVIVPVRSATYTFLSMTAHNWAMRISDAGDFLEKRDRDLLSALAKALTNKASTWGTKKPTDPKNPDFTADGFTDANIGGFTQDWAEEIASALAAKAVVRKLTSEFERDRVVAMAKEWLKIKSTSDKVDAVAKTKDPSATGTPAPELSMRDKDHFSWAKLWRIDRAAEYWREMNGKIAKKGEDVVVAVEQAMGYLDAETKEALEKSNKSTDAVVSAVRGKPVAVESFDDGFKLADLADGGFANGKFYAMYRSLKKDDLNMKFMCVGRADASLKLPGIMVRAGNNRECTLTNVEVLDAAKKNMTLTWKLADGTVVSTDAAGTVK